MKIQSIVFILTCIALSTTSVARSKLYKAEKRDVKEFQMDLGAADGKVQRVSTNDLGNFTNCGDTLYKMQLQWSPAIISTQDIVTIYWDIVASNDWSTGTLHVKVSLFDDPQSELLSLDRDITCEKQMASMPSVNCPIKKGGEIKGQETISNLTKLPTGKFTAELKITNERNLIVMCARGTVELIE